MRRSIDETERRRAKQMAHNEANGIIPKGIDKKIADIMEGAHVVGGKGKQRKVAEKSGKYDIDTNGKDIWHQIAELEEKMFQAAKDLEFEEAARIRDRIHQLKEHAE
jgi:excinuclease ABC subunit B